MTKLEFMDALRQKLLSNGISEKVCAEKCRTVQSGFDKMSPEEAQKCFTMANVDMLVNRIVHQVGKDQAGTATPKKSPAAAPSTPVQEQKSAESAAADAQAKKEPASPQESDSSATPKPTIVINRSKESESAETTPSAKPEDHPQRNTGSGDVIFVSNTIQDKGGAKNRRRRTIDDSLMSEGSKHPKLLLALMALLCAPAILLVILLILGVSLTLAVCMAGVILLVVCVIAAVVCGGSVLSVAGLIYGISQIISEPRYVGIHEIGLAMIFAGATILISVLLYNIAVRLIPFLYKLIGIGLRNVFKKAKEWAILAWKGCENL
ncbi:MAG: hypothetical protein ACI3YK_01050 [Eubacteriales bacterium]